MIQTEGAVGRQVARLCTRHDAYVLADPALAAPAKAAALSESAVLSALVAEIPELASSMLRPALEPVLDRHDGYVRADAALDDLARGIYLGNSEGLRDLLKAGD